MNWLIANRHTVAIFCLIALVVGFSAAFEHYRSEATWQTERADIAEQQLTQANSTISDMQQRQRAIAELDARYTQELADAQNTINQLRNDVADGRRRLQLNASCKPLPDSSSTGSLGNATTPTVTADAERDYWRLRAGIETVTAQVSYLQQYIREQCLK